MSLTPDEAAASLREAEQTEHRSREMQIYRNSAPHCFIWGTIWLICYGTTGLAPRYAGYVWWPLVIGGWLSAMAVGFYQGRTRTRAERNWRIDALMGIIFIASFALGAVVAFPGGPSSGLRIGALYPLIFSAIYAGFGLWVGIRYIMLGAFVAIATLFGFFVLRENFALWMAIVGGGSLILCGFWMRRI